MDHLRAGVAGGRPRICNNNKKGKEFKEVEDGNGNNGVTTLAVPFVLLLVPTNQA